MGKPRKSYLINNYKHEILEFRSRNALLKYCKENGIKPKRSPESDWSSYDSWYVEDFTYLPTGYLD